MRQRLADDQHLWATTLFDEIVALGYDARRWRVDRMATVINPSIGRLQRSFGAGGQALLRGGGGVPAPAWQSQGPGREEHRLPDPAVVAHRPRRLTGARPSAFAAAANLR